MTNVLGQSLEQLIFVIARRRLWSQTFEFFPHTRRKALVDDVVCPMPYNAGDLPLSFSSTEDQSSALLEGRTMKRVRFTEEQIIGVLREHEAGAKTADLARKHGISEATLYNWKAKYGGLDVSEAKRLRALEDENRKLKKLLAELMLDNAVLKESAVKKMVGPVAKREAVAHLRGVLEMSERRACSLVAADRKMIRYRSRRPPDRG